MLSAAIFLALNNSTSFKDKSVIALILLASILFAVNTYLILDFEFYKPMVEKITMEEGTYSKTGSRIIHLQTTIKALTQTPQSILFGYGIANEDALSFFSQAVGGHVFLHSIFLQLLFGSGLIGTVAYITVIIKIYKNQKKCATRQDTRVGFWLITTFLIHATFHPMLFNPVLWTIIPLFLAVTSERETNSLRSYKIKKDHTPA